MRIFPILLILFTCLASSISAQQRQIVVLGTGSVSVVPDLATMNLGVTTSGVNAGAALAENSKKMTAVIAAAKAAGIAGADIQTTNVNLSSQWNQTPENERKIVGYQADNTVNITLRDLANMGAVLDDLTKSGANSIGRLSFGIEDTAPLMDQARQAAIKDGRAKAELYATAAGVTLGQLRLIEEPQARVSQYRGGTVAAESFRSTVPVEVGELSISASVRMIYYIK